MNNQINIQQYYPLLNEKLVMQYWRNSSVSSKQYVNNKKANNIRRNVGIPMLLQQLIAFGLLLLSLPLLLIVALFIYIENPGKVLYCQTRIGENGRHFKFYKFRSMRVNGSKHADKLDEKLSHREGICKKYINDPRVTVVGKFIRKYSIDELPQLFNVLIGDMSLVGPRPALASESYQYNQHQFKRLNCKPGMTGLWQISGRADTSFTQQISLDLQYIRQQSFLYDLKILLETIPAVISAKGAY